MKPWSKDNLRLSGTNAQSAIEFMAIVGVGLMILAATSVIGADYISSYFNDINIINGKQTVNNIVSGSALVYSQGIGGQTRVSVTIPQNVLRNFTYISGTEVNLRLNQQGMQDMFQKTGVNISGSLPIGEGKTYVYIKMVPNSVPGINQGEVKVYADNLNYSYIGVQTYKYNGSVYVRSTNFSTSDTIYYTIDVTNRNDTAQTPQIDLKIYSNTGAILESNFLLSYGSQPYNITIGAPGIYLISAKVAEINSVGTKIFQVY